MDYKIKNDSNGANPPEENNEESVTKNDVNDELFNNFIEDDTYQITKTEIKNYKDKSNEPPAWIKILCIVVVVGLVGSFVAIKIKEANKYNGYYQLNTFIYEGETLDEVGFYLASGDISTGGIAIERDECSLLIIRDADISSVNGTIKIEGRKVTIDKNDIHIEGEYDPDEKSITIVKDDVTYIFHKTSK